MARHRPAVGLALLVSTVAWALQPPATDRAPARYAFFKPELAISSRNVPLDSLREQLSAERSEAWTRFLQQHGPDTEVYLDPRSGTPSGIQLHLPLVPGDGYGNQVTALDLGRRLGLEVREVDAAVVEKVFLQFVHESLEVLGIDESQLGPARVTQVTPDLWQVHVPQQVDGLPVLHGRLAGTISHGNLVLVGTETWGNVKVATLPYISADQALESGLGYAGLSSSPRTFWKEPTLEVVPFAPGQHQSGTSFVGPPGEGYGHWLVWSFGFMGDEGGEKWEVLVDAHSGEVISLQDRHAYLDARITGGVYPLTSTEMCPTTDTCGTMQLNTPMPWANTGLAAPDSYTDGAGIYNHTTGTATTTLGGRYVRISDSCGPVSVTGAGGIAMGGANGEHDCTSAGGSAGNTAASRSAFYELNKLAEMARGWLPANTWLTGQLTANVNINSTCNAFWNGSSVNFYRSGGGCRNTGEIAAVFDHEWGHGLDDFDANGTLSSSSEAYADIAAIFRLQASCVGHGFFWTADQGCGQTADGTGFNQNEARVGAPHCDTNCSGVRDADWARHADATPDTPQNHVCPRCNSGSGPCGRQVHCSAAPVRQAAWDLVTRDLAAAPFGYDSNTAFIAGNKLFYQGSGNVGAWHSCDCTAGTSDGCGATAGYMQWLAADDDNGNLNDGTPHMTAIYDAFNRHNIACATPARVNSGCAGGPAAATGLTASGGDGQVSLSWTGVPGASRYWVMKTEGFAGCDFGKTVAATVGATGYTDTEVANDRLYCYSIVGVGASSSCYGKASNCTCVTPRAICNPPTVPVLFSPANGTTGVNPETAALSWNDQGGGTTYDVEVATDPAFASVVRSATGLDVTSWTVSPSLAPSTQYYWRVRATRWCGTGGYSNAYRFTTAAICVATTATYSATRTAPECTSAGCGCDTGPMLVNSRGALSVPEPNHPNTIDSCADGNSGIYHRDESVDRVRIETLDATDIAVGKQVRVSVTAWCFGTNDALDLYYSTSATTPTWTPLATNIRCPVPGAAHTFVQSLTISGTGGRHAIRAAFRYGGTAGTCSTGAYDDRDDLVFRVGGTASDCTPLAAAYSAPLRAPGCGALACGCDSGTLLDSRGAMPIAEPNQPNTLGGTCFDGSSGAYHFDESIDRIVVRSTDGGELTAGNQATTDVAVWCYSSTSNYLDLFYTASTSSPTWTPIVTGLACGGTGARTFSRTFTLGATAGQHAVRAQLRYLGSAGTCSAGRFNDRDDLHFNVGAASGLQGKPAPAHTLASPQARRTTTPTR